MDRDTVKLEIPESMVTEEIIHDLESTDLTASSQNVLSSKMESDSWVTGPQLNHSELFLTNIRPNSPVHQEDIKQNTSIPPVKQEIIYIFPKKEITEDVYKEEIYDNQIIKEEIQHCKEYIKLEDGMNCSSVDNLTEIVQTESHPVVTKNELSEENGLQEDRNNGNSDDQVSNLRFLRGVCESRILPRALTTTSFNEGSDFGESHFRSSGDHKVDGNKCLMSKHQPRRSKRQKKIRSMDAEGYVPQKGDSWHSNKNKSGQKLCSQHKYSHQGISKKQFSCADCGKFFSRLRNLKTHHLLHTSKKLFTCEICDKSYAQPNGLRSHMITHQEVKPFSCTDCGKCFGMLSSLKNHQLLHTGKKLYACEICDVSFTQPSGLRYHMKSHQAVKPFTCSDCGKSFFHLSILKGHQLLHAGKKLFTCKICDKSFAQPSGLRKHMVTHQVKSFLCADCGKTFSLLSNLKTHQFLHTGKKLFACEICDKTFAQSPGLYQHMKNHQEVKSN